MIMIIRITAMIALATVCLCMRVDASMNKELIDAIFKGEKTKVQQLITAGVNVNALETNYIGGGLTPLISAARNGDVEIVQLLVENGASVHTKNTANRDALWFAANDGKLEVAQFLIAHKAEVNTKDKDGISPLSEAATSGHIGVVKLLIENGANMHVTNNIGGSVINLTARHCQDNTEVISYLLDQENWAPTEEGNSALREAARSGHTKLITLLLEKGADVNATDPTNCTPLMYAASKNHNGAIHCLLDHGANASAIDNTGKNALWFAQNNTDWPRRPDKTTVDMLVGAMKEQLGK